MDEQYEIQIEYIAGNNGVWCSLVTEENTKVYLFNSEEEANTVLEKVQNENYPKLCRIVKI
jgi:hypothetical protein